MTDSTPAQEALDLLTKISMEREAPNYDAEQALLNDGERLLRALVEENQALKSDFETFKVEHHDCVTKALDDSVAVHDEIESRRDGIEAENQQLRAQLKRRSQ